MSTKCFPVSRLVRNNVKKVEQQLWISSGTTQPWPNRKLEIEEGVLPNVS